MFWTEDRKVHYVEQQWVQSVYWGMEVWVGREERSDSGGSRIEREREIRVEEQLELHGDPYQE